MFTITTSTQTMTTAPVSFGVRNMRNEHLVLIYGLPAIILPTLENILISTMAPTSLVAGMNGMDSL